MTPASETAFEETAHSQSHGELPKALASPRVLPSSKVVKKVNVSGLRL